MSANDGYGQRFARSTNTKTIRTQVWRTVQSLKIPPMLKCRVDVEWVVNLRRGRDASNLGLWTKPIYDGIGAKHEPSAHVVPDDSPEYMETPTPTIRLARAERPRFVVTITDLGATR
ncbi:hypothetical protein [Subtercola sp. RTI3]|uniref:hypothetical protein n=1 Tax=Subtercola sp. RTI3 TaxID=3048639 RepID=UPI002B2381D7|nr:hypothetical protein [Subtercola sp. RTI3]MEA9983679.1 hypothetical protein [Subtercola sp. RTI3]